MSFFKFWNSINLKKVRKVLLGNILVCCYFAFRTLPIDLCASFGGTILGKLLSIRSKNANQRLSDNIRLLCPQITSLQEIEKLRKTVWENRGRLFGEYPKLPHIWRSNRTQIVGLENLTETQAYNRPIIFLFLHLGNWTVIGYKLGVLLEGRIIHPYNSPKNPYQRKILESIRRPYLDYFIRNEFSSGKKIVNKLRQGYALFVGVDAFFRGQTSIPSFGRDLLNNNHLTNAVRLAKLSNAVLCPVYAVRKEKSSEFLIHILPSIAPDFTCFDQSEFRQTIIKLDRIMESIVSQHIDQWFYITSLDLNSTAKNKSSQAV